MNECRQVNESIVKNDKGMNELMMSTSKRIEEIENSQSNVISTTCKLTLATENWSRPFNVKRNLLYLRIAL